MYEPIVSTWIGTTPRNHSRSSVQSGWNRDRFGSTMKTSGDHILLEHRRVIDRALEEGVRQAILRHKKESLPVVIERDGKIEWVKPEDPGY